MFDHPVHPYTKGLLKAVSSLRSGAHVLDTIPGVVPNLLHLPEGCAFSPRCPRCMEECRTQMPQMLPAGEEGHMARCFLCAKQESEQAQDSLKAATQSSEAPHGFQKASAQASEQTRDSRKEDSV